MTPPVHISAVDGFHPLSYDIYRTVVAAEDKLTKYNAFTGFVHEAVQSVSLRRAFKKLMEMPNWGDYSNNLGFIHGTFTPARIPFRLPGEGRFAGIALHHAARETLYQADRADGCAAGIRVPHTGIVDGPPLHYYWPLLMKPCEENWWKIFTMSQNYMDYYTYLCMPHYWYISMEYQIAIHSTIVMVAIFPR
ncbi:hypothetical protein V5799_033098 [Amblyomma americanum]|uniref:Uncharacterized protein n=1 Tax=Amblyomma americanum TaxID=6943 RepID=A0AAQ4DPA2_AMBAM